MLVPDIFSPRPLRFSIPAVLFLLAQLGSVAFAQHAVSESVYEPERIKDPPAAFRVNGVSPAHVERFNSFESRQVNVNAQGLNITGDAANEPSIAVSPLNPLSISIGWRQFDSVASNFREAGFAYSTNRGLTWTFPGVLQENTFRSDPVLFASRDGHFFYNSLLQTLFDDIFKSTNGGLSWFGLNGTGNATGGDKQWYTIDNTDSPGRGFQYQSWSTAGNNFGTRQFSRSTDGGVSWMDPINIPNSPRWGSLDVDSAGNLYIGGVGVPDSQFWCIRSSDAKFASSIPTFDQSTPVSLGGSVRSGGEVNPAGLIGMVFLAVDRSGTSTNNNIYMLASVRPTGATTGADVMFARSTDGGQTFSAPKRLNDDPVNQNKWHWFGTLSVAPNGRIDSVWFDSRAAANDWDSQLFYSYSFDGGVNWSPNIAVTGPFDPRIGYPNQFKLGDYITIVSDNDGADVAYAATFNSEQDIYYVRVAPNPAPAPFDFDNDQKTDLSIFRPDLREWWYERSSDGGNAAFQFGSTGDRIVPADFTGDGRTDFAVWRQSSGEWFIARSEDLSYYSFPFGVTGDIPVTADFDGDGKADPAVYRPSTGTWFIQRSSAGFISQNFGISTDLPVASDFDGDRKADIAIFRPTGASGAEWWIAKSSGGVAAFQFGLASDRAVPGDYTGDGKSDVAVWRPSNGNWFILRSENSTFYSAPFGASGDIPVPGDYDGDAKYDLAVFRPTGSTWFANNSTGVSIRNFGFPTDQPVPSAFVR